jgi:hypothetical protein
MKPAIKGRVQMRHKKFDVERELRKSRPQPRVDFVRALADEVRSSPAVTRSPLGRVGLALALSGLIVVALASFGGIGYASSAASHAVKKPEHARVVTKSAAHAQYAPFTPPKVKPKPSASGAAGAAGAKSPNPVAKVKSSQLPFTGLALWVPLAIGLVLIALGLVLRTRVRRRGAGAH